MDLHNPPSEYTLYLAYSREDTPYDRDALGNLIRTINDIYQERSEPMYLRLQESEYYPEGAEKADLIISLSLRHEGDRALVQKLQEADHASLPPALFFFRQLDASEVTQDREAFRMFLENGPKHYWTSYQEIGNVNACILMHLMRHLNIPVEFRSDRLQMGEDFVFAPEDFAALRNSPAMQSLYQELEVCEAECASLRQQNPDFLKDPQYLGASQRRTQLLQKKQQLSKTFFDLLKQFMQHKQEGNLTQRQQKMQEALAEGDLEAAIRIMDRQEILQSQQETAQQIRTLEEHIAQLKSRIGQNAAELLARIHVMEMQPDTSMEDVEPLYQTAMEWEETYDLPRTAWKAYVNDLLEHHQYDKAKEQAEKYMTHADAANSDAARAKAHTWLARCFDHLGNTAQGLTHHCEAEKLYRTLKDADPKAYFSPWAYAYINLANTRNRAGQRLAAIDELEAVIAELKKYEALDKTASLAAQAGVHLVLETCFRHTDWNLAYQHCLDAKALYDELNDPAHGYERFMCSMNLINCLLALNQPTEAQKQMTELEPVIFQYITADLQNRMQETATWLDAKARVLLHKRHPTEKERSQARQHLDNALSILELHKKTFGSNDSSILTLEASLYRRKALLNIDADTPSAYYYCNRANAVLQSLAADDPGVHLSTLADNHLVMAGIYERWDQPENVKRSLQDAVDIVQQNPQIAIFSTEEIAEICVRYASIIFKTQDQEAATSLLPFVTEQAAWITDCKKSAALLHCALGLLYTTLEMWQEAAEAFRPVQQKLDDSTVSIDAVYAFGAYLGLGRALYQQKRFRDALPHLESALLTYRAFEKILESHVLGQTVELARLLVNTYNKLNRQKEAREAAEWVNTQKEKLIRQLTGGKV